MLITLLTFFILAILFSWTSKKVKDLAKYLEKLAKNKAELAAAKNQLIQKKSDHIEETIKEINDLRLKQENRKAVEDLINSL